MHRLLLASAALVLAVSGCSDDSADSDLSPEERLEEAKSGFDDAEFVEFQLGTEALPDGLDEGLLTAEGTGTHDPAFTGEVKVKTGLGDITAPLVAVDGNVYAELPFTGWSELDPDEYGAPDPAGLMDTDAGISSLFTATEDVSEGDSERDEEKVLTRIEGTLPADAVKGVFPSSG
ncbi:MAG: LppX_LprAFG lipoprotein, partial [Nocardioidaceae bacterium]